MYQNTTQRPVEPQFLADVNHAHPGLVVVSVGGTGRDPLHVSPHTAERMAADLLAAAAAARRAGGAE